LIFTLERERGVMPEKKRENETAGERERGGGETCLGNGYKCGKWKKNTQTDYKGGGAPGGKTEVVKVAGKKRFNRKK